MGIRIPKVKSPEDVPWVADRAPGTPLICAIESARGVLAAAEIATVASVPHLSMGGVDLRHDLNASGGNLQTLYVRSHLVLVSRAAGLQPPIDSVYPHLDDDSGQREQATFARSLGLFGKSAIHPRQLPETAERSKQQGRALPKAELLQPAVDSDLRSFRPAYGKKQLQGDIEVRVLRRAPGAG